jgi:hypothetical protein
VNILNQSKRLIAHFATALVIAGEVILINLLSYASDIYLPPEVGPYLSFEILFCLPLLQAAQLIAVGPLQNQDHLDCGHHGRCMEQSGSLH